MLQPQHPTLHLRMLLGRGVEELSKGVKMRLGKRKVKVRAVC